MRKAAILLPLLLLASTADAAAADREALMARATDPETGAFPPGWAIGPGMFFKNSLYETEDSTLLPVPTLYYRGERCMIYVKKGSCSLFESKHVELGALLDLRLDGYEEDDGDFLDGMDERHLTLDAGLALEFDTPVGDIELEALHDILGNHEGYEVLLGWSAPIVLKSWVINFALAHHWKSSDLADYYYAVEPDEALPGRPEFSVGSTTSWSLTATVNYRLSRKWLTLLLAEYEGFSSDIEDSPIVEESGQLKALVGFARKFGK